MSTEALLKEGHYESTLLREAAEKLNFIWRLAYAYKPPELLHFLEDLAGELEKRKEFLSASLEEYRGHPGK